MPFTDYPDSIPRPVNRAYLEETAVFTPPLAEPTHQMPFPAPEELPQSANLEETAVFMPPLAATALPPVFIPPEELPQPTGRAHLSFVPRPADLGRPTPRPVAPIPKTATSAIACDECGAALDLTYDVYPEGPDWANGPRRVDVQGLGSPYCPNPNCPSNGGGDEGPPQSGEFPKGEFENR
jgi:hypothetical protein